MQQGLHADYLKEGDAMNKKMLMFLAAAGLLSTGCVKQADYDALAADKAILESELAAVREKIAGTETDMVKMKEALAREKARAERADTAKQQVQSQLAAAQSLTAAQGREVEPLKSKISGLESELGVARASVKKLTGDLEVLKAASGAVQAMQAEIAELKATISGQEQKLQKLRNYMLEQ